MFVCEFICTDNKQNRTSVLNWYLNHHQNVYLVFDGTPIPQVNSIKYLGVILSHDLSWARHIDSVCMTAKHRVGFLYRQFHLAGPSCLTQLYKSLVIPILDHCSCVWDPNYTLYIDKLESVQRFATKVILRDWNSCYNDQMKLLNLPLLSIRRKRQKLSLYAIELCLVVLLSLPASLLRIPVRLYVMPITCHYTILGSEPLPIRYLFMLVLFLLEHST